MSAIAGFRVVMRLLLGDKAVHGVTAYADDELDGAVKAIFRLGEAPEGML